MLYVSMLLGERWVNSQLVIVSVVVSGVGRPRNDTRKSGIIFFKNNRKAKLQVRAVLCREVVLGEDVNWGRLMKEGQLSCI